MFTQKYSNRCEFRFCIKPTTEAIQSFRDIAMMIYHVYADTDFRFTPNKDLSKSIKNADRNFRENEQLLQEIYAVLYQLFASKTSDMRISYDLNEICVSFIFVTQDRDCENYTHQQRDALVSLLYFNATNLLRRRCFIRINDSRAGAHYSISFVQNHALKIVTSENDRLMIKYFSLAAVSELAACRSAGDVEKIIETHQL